MAEGSYTRDYTCRSVGSLLFLVSYVGRHERKREVSIRVLSIYRYVLLYA